MPGSGDLLARFLRPRSVAIVGASENQVRSNYAFNAMRDSGLELILVNPNRPEVYGLPTYPSVSAADRPIDAVLSIVAAEAAVQVVADARQSDVGGVVVIAGGFGESGPEGAELEASLAEAAGDLPVLGPNCNGFVRPAIGARLTGAPVLPMPSGGLGVITHSGALMAGFGLEARERAIGISTVISTGNEMQLGMAECLEFLVDDDATTVIALVAETLRRPDLFFTAARRALAAGKPVVALKLGRSQRGREIATSHTGALAGEAWVYDSVFRQHGVCVAQDLEDLMDRVALLEQIPRERWTPVKGLGVLSLSGGWSALTGDMCGAEGVPVPALRQLAPQVNELIPDRSTLNPLDMTGFALGRPELMETVADLFLGSGEVDVLAFQWFIDQSAVTSAAPVASVARTVAAMTDVPIVLGGIDDSRIGEWAAALREDGIGVGRGIRGTVRGIRAMAEHMQSRRRAEVAVRSLARWELPAAPIPSVAGPLLPFEATMELLGAIGVPVAPYVVIEAEHALNAAHVPFPGPYVLKLADVPHRTELGAVRVRVSDDQLAGVVAELREIAASENVPGRVALQPLVDISGEAFLGLEPGADLGPLLVSGIGGVAVESGRKVTARIAPLSQPDVDDLLEELASFGVFEQRRGSVAWSADDLRPLLVSLGAFAVAASGWLQSLDINPLAVTSEGYLAVDGLCIVKSAA